MTRLILLDRDGVINYDSPDYVKDAAEWVPLPGALDAIARLKAAGYLVGVCTNQSGIGRGLFDAAALERIHRRMIDALAERGAVLDALHYCPHHPDDGCDCRKPRPGMLIEAMSALAVAPAETVFVGDSGRDAQAAAAAGCRAVLVRSGQLQDPAIQRFGAAVADDLASWVEQLLADPQC